jgi:NADH:ubiquinone oxidoreductase subunit 6 (subunit J)
MSWVLWSAATAWALAALFVMMAALTRAPTAAKERGMRWVWLALLIATLAALSWMAVAYFGPNALGFDLNSGFYVPVAVAAVVVLTALYWLTTLFATPDTMGPSVPFHELMPRLSGRRLP